MRKIGNKDFQLSPQDTQFENGCGKLLFLVWNRVRIWGTGRHTPTKNSQEYPPGGFHKQKFLEFRNPLHGARFNNKNISFQVGFGINLNNVGNPDSAFPSAVSKTLEGMQANLQNPFWMFQISSFPFQNSVVEAIRYLRYFAKNVIEERGLALHNGDETPNDILQHIVKGAQEDSEFDMDDMVDNFFTIFIAGIKTKLYVPSCCLFVCFSKNSHPASVTIEYVCNNQPFSTALFYFIRFANYWQGHPNSMTPITACGPVTVPPPMRDRPPHRGLRPLLFTNSVWVL